MIKINGKNFSGNNLVIVNGKVISGEIKSTASNEKFDEWKTGDCTNVDRITIDTAFADLDIFPSSSSTAEAHLYGKANVDGELSLDLQVVGNELKVTLKNTCNCFSGFLKLEILIPKKSFKAITVKGTSSDVFIGEGISAEHLKVKTMSGDLKNYATFKNFSASTMSGDITFKINATQNITTDISTMSGDVLAYFCNIKHINLSTSSMTGKIRNYHDSYKGFSADVDISTMSGDIKIK